MAPVPDRVKHIGRALRRRRQLLRRRRRSGRKPSIDSPYHRRGGPLDRRRRATEAHVTSESTILDALAGHRIELPSWAFGNSGTRFKVFAQKGVPRDPYEKVADAAEVHRYTGVAPTVALHIPWDKVDDYADLGRHAEGLRRRARDDQLEHVPGRRLHAGQRLPPEPARPAEGDRPPARVRRHHGRHRLARPQAVVRGRDELPGPGRHPRPPGPAGRGAADRLRAAGRRPADGARVQAVRAVVLHDRRPRLGDGPRALRRAGVAGPGRRRHRPPRARHQHRVHRRRAAAGRQARRRSTSTRGSTPTTTSWSARPTRSSCSGSCTRS